MPQCEIFGFARGGRSCSTVAATAAAETVIQRPDLLPDLLAGLNDGETVIRSQFAYALARVAEKRPDLAQPHAGLILDRLAAPDDSHITRACLLQATARLHFSPDDAETLKDILRDCMHSAGSIVKTFAMQMGHGPNGRNPARGGHTPRLGRAGPRHPSHAGQGAKLAEKIQGMKRRFSLSRSQRSSNAYRSLCAEYASSVRAEK